MRKPDREQPPPMNPQLKKKLAELPAQPGVYYHLDAAGQVIYVGKAAHLRNRVRHYFQPGALAKADRKTRNLAERIADVRWTTTENPLQALFLEGEMIKRYLPKYNVVARNALSDSWYYVKLNYRGSNPNLILTRNVADAAAAFLGPYPDGRALKRALVYLRRSFPYSVHERPPQRPCLDYHLGLCPGPEVAGFNAETARANLRRLAACLSGRQTGLVKRLHSEMRLAATSHEFERAGALRDQIAALRGFKQSIIFGGLPGVLGSDQALEDLRRLLCLNERPRRVEAYDVSHISGSHVTASMAVAQDGVIRPALSRRFRARTSGNDDFGQIRDVLRRRFASASLAAVPPDVILIDGGRGQVSAALEVLGELQLNLPTIGLAKKKEEVIFKTGSLAFDTAYLKQLGGSSSASANFTTLSLNLNTPLVKFLQRLRDASHRLALTYHNYLQAKQQTSSEFLDLPGIGPATYRKLIKRFGSAAGLRQASPAELGELLNAQQLKGMLAHLREPPGRRPV